MIFVSRAGKFPLETEGLTDKIYAIQYRVPPSSCFKFSTVARFQKKSTPLIEIFGDEC